MKKSKLLLPFMALLILLLGLQSCQREEIDVVGPNKESFDQAFKIGKTMMKSSIEPRNSNKIASARKLSENQDFALKDYLTKTSTSGKELYYIINYKPEGFAIVTASNKFKQRVLAFSAYGSFDNKNLNPALKEWITGMDSVLTVDIEKPEKSVDLLPNLSKTTTTTTVVGPLVTTFYDQGAGFNQFVEVYGGGSPTTNCTTTTNGRPPAGCVPVAMAQLMNYWRPGNLYPWTQISQENAGGNGGTYTAQMIALLGNSVGTTYNCGGSGTLTDRAFQHFKTVKKTGAPNTYFNNAIQYIPYNLNTVIANLNANRPVYVDGFYANNNVGHAWVIDGYQINANGTYLHHNWGWRGSGNAFYLVGPSSPHATNYNTNNKIISNLFLN